MPLKIVIAGHGRHGKDTLAEFLRDQYGLSFSSSSWMACNLFIYNAIRHQFGYTNIDDCYADRGNHRQLWFDMIVDFNTPDLARLGKAIFSQHPVYCGIRNKDELNALKKEHDVLVIWVDASKRKPLEPSTSMTVSQDDAHLILSNNGTLEEFHKNIRSMAAFFNLS